VGVVAEAMTLKLSANTQVQAFVRGVIEKQSKSGLIGALKAMAERKDFMDYLSTVVYPVVLIHGNADVLIPVERAREIKAVLSSARLVELQDAGHMPMMEFAQATAEGLRFLAG
jgi:pimeloyl-ACP methyl ester carboxylesterase